MFNRKTFLAGLAAVALTATIAGCGTDQAQEPAPAEPQTSDSQAYDEVEGEAVEPWTVEYDGTTYEVNPADEGPWEAGQTFSVEGTEATIILTVGVQGPQDIEDYRTAVHAPEVGYIAVDIDNRQGATDVGITGVTIHDPEGNAYEYQSAFIPVGDWDVIRDYDTYTYSLPDGTPLTEEEGDALDRQGTEVYDSYLNGPGEVGSKGREYFIGDPIPAQFTTASFGTALTMTGEPTAIPAQAKG